MHENVVAISHPGKMGDALYTLPAIRFLMGDWKAEVDFYTSEYCKPMWRLMEYQKGIRNFIIPPAYKILRNDTGIQPWEMPIDRTAYLRVVHMGFRSTPTSELPSHIARSVGVPPEEMPRVYYDYPEIQTLDEPYICVAPRGNTTYKDLFRDVIVNSPVAVAVIGGPADGVTAAERTIHDKPIIDLIGLDMLETVSWLSKCVGFMGLMSAMLVLANGFDMPKVIPHDNIHWDLRHVLKTPSHKYLVLPNMLQVIKELGL